MNIHVLYGHVHVLRYMCRFHSMELPCLQEAIKDHLAEIVSEFHKDIEITQNVSMIQHLYMY